MNRKIIFIITLIFILPTFVYSMESENYELELSGITYSGGTINSTNYEITGYFSELVGFTESSNYKICSGLFCVLRDIVSPIVSSVSPSTETLEYIKSNDILEIIFTYTEDNPKNYTVKIHNETDTICQITKTSGIEKGTSITVTESCTVSDVNGYGLFNVTVEMYDIFDEEVLNTQTDAVMVDNILPYNGSMNSNGTITFDGSKYASGTINLTAEALDDESGIDYIEFYYSDETEHLINTDTTEPYEIQWDTSGIPDGTYNVTIKAYDKAGNLIEAD